MTLALAALVVGEVFWRSQGFRPSIVDDAEFWSFWRGKASRGGPNCVVLLGASRIQADFHTPTFRGRFPHYRLTQLAVRGEAPVAALRDLADDEEFCGLAVCSVMCGWLRNMNWHRQQDYVDHFHCRSTLNSCFNRLIGCWLQARLVVIHPTVNMKSVVMAALGQGDLPKPGRHTFHFDRSRSIDFTHVDVADLRRRLLRGKTREAAAATRYSTERFRADLLTIRAFVRQIQERGGEVVFVRFPTSGPRVAIDEKLWPKEVYWDRIGTVTGAVTIHYRDVPSLRGFHCPDMSHLDYRDAPRFTNALLEELVRHGLLVDAVGADDRPKVSDQ